MVGTQVGFFERIRKVVDYQQLFYLFCDEARHGVALKGMLERYFK